MQVSYFSTGGFVIHYVNPSQHFSAWYDESGHVVDLEARDRLGRVKRSSEADRQRAASLGWIYRR